MKIEQKDRIIDAGANIAGNVVLTLLPSSLLLGAVLSPIVKGLITDIAKRMLSHSEDARIVYVGKQLITKVQERLDANEQPRCDDEFYVMDEYNQSSASKLLEEVFIKCKQEFEAKKLKYFGNFWPNICFDNNVTYDTANSILTQFSLLSHNQVKILAYLNSGVTIPLDNWERYMHKNDRLSHYYYLYSDCLNLYNMRLVSPCDISKGIKIGTPDISISPSGRLMCALLEIELTSEEYNETDSLISNINRIVQRLMDEKGDDGIDNIIEHVTDNEIDAMFNDIFRT